MISSQGADPQKIMSLPEKERLTAVHWSLDGKQLGYVHVRQISGGFTSSIETVDLDNGSRTVVVLNSGLWIADFCWLPDERIVYSTQKPPGADDDNLWAVGTRAGAEVSKPKRITEWAGAQLDGMSAQADGKQLVLQKRHSHGQIYLGQLSANGAHMSPPRRLTMDEADDWPTAWTTDSRTILFSSYRNSTWQILKQ